MMPFLGARKVSPETVRGKALWMMALILGLKGGGYVHAASAQTDSTLRVVTHWVPLEVCGWLWIVACLIAAVASYWSKRGEDFGYTVLGGFCAGWAAIYALAPIIGGPLVSFQGALSYLLVFLFIRFLSRSIIVADVINEMEKRA